MRKVCSVAESIEGTGMSMNYEIGDKLHVRYKIFSGLHEQATVERIEDAWAILITQSGRHQRILRDGCSRNVLPLHGMWVEGRAYPSEASYLLRIEAEHALEAIYEWTMDYGDDTLLDSVPATDVIEAARLLKLIP